MREILTDKGKILIHESIKELPIHRFTDFNKYLIQDIGIGSTMDDVDKHFRNMDVFLEAGKLDECKVERYNMHYNFYLMLNKIDIKSISFACLVHSINKVEIEDFTETNLVKIGERLGLVSLNRGQLEEILSEVKKKLIASLN